jgi:polyisoprenoid-binding protein YceI
MARPHRTFALALALPALLLALGAFAPKAAAADSYDIDPVHSVIIFRIKHMDVGMFYGRFNGPTGKFTFDEQDPSKSTFQAQVKAASFDSGEPKRDQHVRGPDFLNAKEFPNISFKSKSVKPADGGSRFEVSGDLTLHGQTKPVTIAMEKIGTAGNRIGFEGVMEIRRSDFGIRGVQGVADEVRLIIAFEGTKK